MSVVVTGEHPSSGPAAGGAARLARAMATLAAAEQRTGVRRVRAPRSHGRAGEAAVPRAVPLPAARQPLAAASAGARLLPAPASAPGLAAGAGLAPVPALVPVPDPAGDPTSSSGVAVPPGLRRQAVLPRQHEQHLPVHPALAGLLPGAVLPAGGVLAVLGSTSLLLGLLGAASQEGAWVAFVGAPALGMLAAADAGLELERVALVQDPGPDAPIVVAALLDGVDVVVLGPKVTLLDSDRRRLAARARERGTVLATTTPWPGAHVSLDARGGSWSGADQGAGWLRRRTLSVLRTGRGAAARPVEIDVEVPVVAAETPAAPAPAAATRPFAPSATGDTVLSSPERDAATSAVERAHLQVVA